MSEQFDNAMMLAIDAFKANNESECKSFCNQALTVNPTSSKAKALKGAAVLISFSLAGAASDAVEALEIWKSITDLEDCTLEYQSIIIDSAYDFATRWRDASDEHYKKFKDVEGADKEHSATSTAINNFRKTIAYLDCIEDELTNRAVQNCKDKAYYKNIFLSALATKVNEENTKKLMECAYEGLKANNAKEKGAPSYSDLDYARTLVNKCLTRNDDLGLKAKEMQGYLDVAKKARNKKILITLGIIAVVIVIIIIAAR